VIKEKTKSQIREWVESILIAVVLALLIRTFVIQAFKIPSGSMIPTFEIGDRIFVSKFIYGARIPFTGIRLPGLRQPKTGDIIVFVSPESPKKDFVKRLVFVYGGTFGCHLERMSKNFDTLWRYRKAGQTAPLVAHRQVGRPSKFFHSERGCLIRASDERKVAGKG